jgi:UDP-N-acetylmuramate--alanine ligase
MIQEVSSLFMKPTNMIRNFLNFRPALSLITNVDYDHPEIYPTRESYIAAFEQFKDQSDKVIGPLEDSDIIPGIRLNGFHNRYNASLAIKAVQSIYTESDLGELIEYIDEFPGTGRRMEKLAKNVYSDYAHTPEELAATMQMLSEMFDTEKITVVYQPHQNKRQQNIMDTGGYKDSLDLASEIYWLPTYLTRGEVESTVKTEALIENLYNSGIAKSAEMNDILLKDLAKDYRDGSVIVFFGAGSIDAWARQNLNQIVA